MEDITVSTSPAAVIVPTLALITLIIDVPPFVWHIRNRNLSASALILWVLLANSMNFLNALIWPRDDLADWWHGYGLCDVEVKFMVAIPAGLLGCVLCITRNLAKVLDTKRTVLQPSKAQLRRQLAFDWAFCLIIPMWMMLAHYVVQPSRYYIFGIAGCNWSVDNSWPKIVLLLLWPNILILVIVFYSVVLIIRMRRYRNDFAEVLSSSSSNLSKNRFLRLFGFAMTLVVILTPGEFYLLYKNLTIPFIPYSWDLVHGPGWGYIMLAPANGSIPPDRWLQIAVGFAIFLFFGLGHDALEMYRKWLLVLGFGKVFPSLRDRHQNTGNSSQSMRSRSWRSSMGSRARLFVSKRFSRSSTASFTIKEDSSARSEGTLTPPPSQRLAAFTHLPTIAETTERVPNNAAVPEKYSSEELSPASPESVPTSWLHSFLVSTHLAAPNRRMGAGLGGFGALQEPRYYSTHV